MNIPSTIHHTQSRETTQINKFKQANESKEKKREKKRTEHKEIWNPEKGYTEFASHIQCFLTFLLSLH